EALPCGSRSMMSNGSPAAAQAVPRLIAVVVLPTPPFWLAMARTRGGVGFGMRVASGTACASAVSVMAWRPSKFARESVGILGCYPAAFQVADDDDPTARIGAA